jgi:phosphatidate cytidylyltransferase
VCSGVVSQLDQEPCILSKMKRILTAAILIPIVLLLVFKAPTWLLTIAAGLVAETAAWEFLSISESAGARPPRSLISGSIAIMFFVSFQQPDMMGPLLSGLSLLILVVCAFRSPMGHVLPDSASAVLCLLYVGFSLTTIPWLGAQANGPSLLTFLFAVVWVGDTAALVVGKTYGSSQLAPTISPNKTWEGAIASVVSSVLITFLLIFLSEQLSQRSITALAYPGATLHWVLLAVVLNVVAQLGDLAESALKRGAGMKDSGRLLPGHGGILDRIDALLLAAPFLWYAQIAQQYF